MSKVQSPIIAAPFLRMSNLIFTKSPFGDATDGRVWPSTTTISTQIRSSKFSATRTFIGSALCPTILSMHGFTLDSCDPNHLSGKSSGGDHGDQVNAALDSSFLLRVIVQNCVVNH